jgi:hypothetical protein
MEVQIRAIFNYGCGQIGSAMIFSPQYRINLLEKEFTIALKTRHHESRPNKITLTLHDQFGKRFGKKIQSPELYFSLFLCIPEKAFCHVDEIRPFLEIIRNEELIRIIDTDETVEISAKNYPELYRLLAAQHLLSSERLEKKGI